MVTTKVHELERIGNELSRKVIDAIFYYNV